MGTTQDNLKAAFAGESQASRRYLFFGSSLFHVGKSNRSLPAIR